MRAPDGAPPPRAATPAPRAESKRFAIRALHRALSVTPNVEQACRVCGQDYTPVAASYIVCSSCHAKLRTVMSHRDLVIGLAVKVLAGELRAVTAPADTDA